MIIQNQKVLHDKNSSEYLEIIPHACLDLNILRTTGREAGLAQNENISIIKPGRV